MEEQAGRKIRAAARAASQGRRIMLLGLESKKNDDELLHETVPRL